MKKASILFFLVIGFACIRSSFASVNDTTSKREIQSLLARMQNTEKALQSATQKKEEVTTKLQTVQDDWTVAIQWQKRHDANPVHYDPEKPKPPAAIAYDDEAATIETTKSAIIARGQKLDIENTRIANEMDSLHLVQTQARGLLKLKTFDVLKYFNTVACGDMPPENASLIIWKSYLDCLFDGNTSPYMDPVNPGGMRITPNDPGIIVDESDAASRKAKEEAIKKILTEPPKKDRKVMDVPPPVSNGSGDKPQSLSDKVKDALNLIMQKFKTPRKTIVGTPRG